MKKYQFTAEQIALLMGTLADADKALRDIKGMEAAVVRNMILRRLKEMQAVVESK